MTSFHKSAPALVCTLLCSIATVALTASAGQSIAANSDGSFVVALTAEEELAIAKAKAKAKAAKQHQTPPANAVVKPVPGAPKAVAAPPPPPPAAHSRVSVPRHIPGRPLPNQPVAKSVVPTAPAATAAPVTTQGGSFSGHSGSSFSHVPAPVPVAATAVAIAAPTTLHAVKAGRQHVAVPGTNQSVVKEADKRLIIRNGNKAIIRHDEAARFVKATPNATVQKAANGNNTTIINRANNVQIFNITNADGQLVRRYRRDGDGHEYDIIDNRPHFEDHDDHTVRNVAIAAGVGLVAGALIMHAIDTPEPRVEIPPEKYVVHYNRASDDDVYEALSAPPIQRLERRYTLDEVRETYHLRQHMRRVELDDINFETGSWAVEPAEYRTLERMARGMLRAIEANPNEVFMIEGYTDAVGDPDDNLTLSDRRAEAVAEVLTREFNVPPENLTTQGYGEQYLLVETAGPNRENRHVAVRRITPLISDNRQPN